MWSLWTSFKNDYYFKIIVTGLKHLTGSCGGEKCGLIQWDPLAVVP